MQYDDLLAETNRLLDAHGWKQQDAAEAIGYDVSADWSYVRHVLTAQPGKRSAPICRRILAALGYATVVPDGAEGAAVVTDAATGDATHYSHAALAPYVGRILAVNLDFAPEHGDSLVLACFAYEVVTDEDGKPVGVERAEEAVCFAYPSMDAVASDEVQS
ncbi:MAG: hypothetical protein AAFQ53_14945 [Bacteroidota bacterium]